MTRRADWFWLGLAIGAGFLAKFTNGVQLGCIGFFLLWSKEHRPLLFSRKMFVMCAAFGVSILPILWWNIQTGWVHAIALHSRSGVTNKFQIHPVRTAEISRRTIRRGVAAVHGGHVGGGGRACC